MTSFLCQLFQFRVVIVGWLVGTEYYNIVELCGRLSLCRGISQQCEKDVHIVVG